MCDQTCELCDRTIISGVNYTCENYCQYLGKKYCRYQYQYFHLATLNNIELNYLVTGG